ncbi:Dinitrogenase reductase activating glycohydrolase [Planctomycetales bacterium 10988]|nr:Dinitrogenase reductase activating glycohydrolase [Planctomycetales bacterium 10988]
MERRMEESLYRGGIYGHLLGDAFGVPYEFLDPEALPEELIWRGNGTHHQPIGTWSDDGALMLCQLDSLQTLGTFDLQDTGNRFVRWKKEGYCAAGGEVFDIGMTTNRALSDLEQGVEPIKAGLRGESSNGNGSLMRILPLSLWAAEKDPLQGICWSHQSSQLTHGHVRSQVCCALYTLIVRGLVQKTLRDSIIEGVFESLRNAYQEYPQETGIEQAFFKPEGFLSALDLVESYAKRQGSGYVVDSFWSAWEAFVGSESFEDCIKRAVRYGNDTDTTAAIAGGLAGIYYQDSGLPEVWKNELRLETEHVAMIDSFVAVCSS